jgi:hypothetical protein
VLDLVDDLKEVPPTLPPDFAAHASFGKLMVKNAITIKASIDFFAN